jgi:hypothetical protein
LALGNIVSTPMSSFAGTDEWNILYKSDYADTYHPWYVFDGNLGNRALQNYETGVHYSITSKTSSIYKVTQVKYYTAVPSQSSGNFFIEYYNGTSWIRHQAVNITLATGENIINLTTPMVGKGFRLFWDVATYADTSEIIFWGEKLNYYYLFKTSDNNLMTYTTSWNNVGTYPPNADLFLNSGMRSLDNLNKDELSLLNGPSLLLYTQGSTTSKSFSLTANHNPKICKVNLNLSEVENFDSFTLTSGMCKFLVSNDNGLNWYYFDGTSFIQSPSTISDIETNGMVASTFNTISSTNLTTFFSSKKVSFSFLLKDGESVDSIVSQVDLFGTWNKANLSYDYDYYFGNTLLSIKFYVSTNYKVNS